MTTLTQFGYVAVGGMLGAVLRYGAYIVSSRVFENLDKIWVTATVNIVGSFLLGCLFSVSRNSSFDQKLALLLMIGLLGSFTTFSTFAIEGVELYESGRTTVLLTYVVVSNVLSLLAALFGVVLFRSIGS